MSRSRLASITPQVNHKVMRCNDWVSDCGYNRVVTREVVAGVAACVYDEYVNVR